MTYPAEPVRPGEHRDLPNASIVTPAEDVRTIMLNQVSWGAVIAGAAAALVVQIVLNMVGLGIGLATLDPIGGNNPSGSSISIGAGLWWVISGIIASGAGGYFAGRLSGKPSTSTTGYHGLISWAVATLVVVYLLASAAGGLVGGAMSTVSGAIGGAGKALGGGLQTAVQAAAPSIGNAGDPFAAIEGQVRSASGGQDPAALRDAAVTAVRGAVSGDPSQQAQATDRAAQALARAQGIPVDQARTQVQQYVQQYQQAVATAKVQAQKAADVTATAVSRGALFGALALILGALAAFFAGRSSAVDPTVTVVGGLLAQSRG